MSVRRKNQHNQAPSSEQSRKNTVRVSGKVATGNTVGILNMPKTALECFGGKEGFAGFLGFLEDAKKGETSRLAVASVDGVDLYPGTGIPSLFIAPDVASAHDGAQQLMFSAMMNGRQFSAGIANIHEGEEAIPYINDFLTKALEVLGPELSQEEIARTKSLITTQEQTD